MATPNQVKSGFIAVVGRPNAGKSSLINKILGEKLTMVSKKANATRKRSLCIHMHKNHQLIFIDTPGIHETERLLNQFMLKEALKAMGDCDLVIFLAPASDGLGEYEKFLDLKSDKIPHLLILTKADTISNEDLLKKIKLYQKYQDKFKALLPLSIKGKGDVDFLCDEIIKYLPNHPYLYDPQILTTQNMRDIYKEYIREAIFKNTSEEIPYFADAIINSVEEGEKLIKIFATIVVEKGTQKAIILGKNASTLKRIGKDARILMEDLSKTKVFLKLHVSIKENWSKNKKKLGEIGYFI
ncbi:MAG: GTPase Era [Proteobacteria bacterium]|nr:MAG: GTPase Era [Pseudomonadota bacterium]